MTKSDELKFVEETHSYWIGKKKIPSVNEILRKVGLLKDYSMVSPFYADRGKATHLAIKYTLEGILDPKSIDEIVGPHYQAWQNYWESHKDEKVLKIETPMVDLPASFAGTPDLITDKAIYDWKCSKSHDPAADLQGMGYKILALHNGLNSHSKIPFIVVELHDDGSFAIFEYGDGYEEWSSVLDLYRWKINGSKRVGTPMVSEK